ncbi:MAG: zinc-binding dehydrogenase [Rhizobiales bacterium]|nr:zinc-binding dehydrogenase [Hyphomicrobiales bacterium]
MSNLPSIMKAVTIREPGGPEMLEWSDVEMPRPGHGEVLIKIAGAGVNRGDCMQRIGFYPPPKGASPIMGLEASGTIAALGEGVTLWKVGDEVCALMAGGGYAEYCTVHESHVLPVPVGVSLVEAAALPEALMTVWTNVFERGRLAPGETFLIHGGTSGIGTAAIQLGVSFGARVIATAGSADKCAACLKLGANAAINYRGQDFVEEVQKITEGHGADVILDMVGGDYVQRNMAAAAENGRIVNIAFMNGFKLELNLLPIMLKKLTLTGSTLRGRSIEEKAALTKAVHDQIWPLIDLGRIRQPVDSIFPMKEAGKAHELMEKSSHIGKILLTP